jgi:multiple sugar transport system substrate-binding protein
VQVRAILLAAALALAPPSIARAADLVVWWERGYYPEEDRAVEELVTAFEQKTGKDVELKNYPFDEFRPKLADALAGGHTPDFVFFLRISDYLVPWAYEGRLLDLSDVLEPLAHNFDPEAFETTRMFDVTVGRSGVYAVPIGRATNHVHVWKSLLERAGFTLADIPKEWDAFWSFWCDRVQPAVRKATGRDDIYGIGIAMSVEAGDTGYQLTQFQWAHDAGDNHWFAANGTLVIDEPALKARLVEALGDYTAIWRKRCTPPGSVDWLDADNNKAFLAQQVVMTVNQSLSITNALRTASPEDYYENAATIEWPATNARGRPLAIHGNTFMATVFKAGRNNALAKDFVRFLVDGGWLAHYLDFAQDRFFPPMPALVRQPFWLDPGDPHRMRSAMQVLTRPSIPPLMWGVPANKLPAFAVMDREEVWPKAVHRVVADGLTPEQAVDEAIARIKQIMSE